MSEGLIAYEQKVPSSDRTTELLSLWRGYLPKLESGSSMGLWSEDYGT